MSDLAAALGVDTQDLSGLPSPVSAVAGGGGGGADADLGLAVRFQCGEPALVLIEVDPVSVTVAEASIRWHSNYPLLELGRVHARFALPVEAESLCSTVQAAATARQAAFGTCARCGRHLPSEHITDVDDEIVCHGCATKYHGVLF